jgi:hypothetical protein
MPRQPATVDATFYAQIEPKWSDARWSGGRDDEGHPILEGAKVVRLTQERPKRPASSVVVVKLTVRLPAGAFLPLRPEAIIVVPEGMAEAIVVEALDPSIPPDELEV